jgi:hypothetical protein
VCVCIKKFVFKVHVCVFCEKCRVVLTKNDERADFFGKFFFCVELFTEKSEAESFELAASFDRFGDGKNLPLIVFKVPAADGNKLRKVMIPAFSLCVIISPDVWGVLKGHRKMYEEIIANFA